MFTLPRGLSPKQILDVIETESELIQVIDMRSQEEFTVSRIKDSCRVPMSELPRLLEKLENQRLVVIVDACGAVAKDKVELLSQFSNVVYLLGGFNEWKKQNLPTVEDLNDEKCRVC